MKHFSYKYFAGITSQIFFCGIPLRLDSYNHCQFDCAYCFAKTRGGMRGSRKISPASTTALLARLERVNKGIINSALDEFIAHRIPFQLGGMADPFTAIEKKLGTTSKILSILANFNYPTVISTKNAKAFTPQIIELLKRGNFYVRFSISMLDTKARSIFETTTSSLSDILRTSEVLAHTGVPSSIRFQPIFPETEEQYLKNVAQLASSGIKYVSLEYLKVPVDTPSESLSRLNNFYSLPIVEKYKQLGAKRLGREYVLPRERKIAFFKSYKAKANRAGIGVGLADNEFLHLSDGNACCGGGNLFLREANFFDANIQSVLRDKKIGEYISFDNLEQRWMPKLSVGTYLNSNSRLPASAGDWLTYLQRDWNGDSGIYSPDFFFGVRPTSHVDVRGFKIYEMHDRF